MQKLNVPILLFKTYPKAFRKEKRNVGCNAPSGSAKGHGGLSGHKIPNPSLATLMLPEESRRNNPPTEVLTSFPNYLENIPIMLDFPCMQVTCSLKGKMLLECWGKHPCFPRRPMLLRTKNNY